MLLHQPHATDAYGKHAQDLLKPIQGELTSLARLAVEKFYALLPSQGKAMDVLNRLSIKKFEQLKKHHAQYLGMLTSDALTQDALRTEAHKIGEMHCFSGVEMTWLTEVYGLYQDEIYKLLKKRIHNSDKREFLIRVIAQRFLEDNEGQASSYKQVALDVTSAFLRIDQVVFSADNLATLIRDSLEVAGSLPGGVSAFFARLGNDGKLHIEQTWGDAAAQYHQAMDDGVVPKISIDEALPAGRGPGGRAWRSGEIITSDAWLIEADKAPWREVGEKLGFRSSAAIPVHGDTHQSVALLSLYSKWPGYFSHENVRSFLSHTQQVISHGVQLQMHAPAIPIREQGINRKLLNERRIVMRYQPVISLTDGRLIKIEGLARLRKHDGGLIEPQQFLSAFTHDDLFKLFEYGLHIVCEDLIKLKSQGISTNIAINLPAEGLGDQRYERSFINILKKFNIRPSSIQLEVLETQDRGGITDHKKAFIRRLKELGVQISQDDLGSGHSSLLRLDQYPFHEVKIDQGLVRGGLHNPKRALDFIFHLTRLAHAINVLVTVEGLENNGLVEAAAILGADFGQGYQIAEPMPLEQLPAWRQSYTFSIDPQAPKTALGAMAAFLIWDMQLSTTIDHAKRTSQFASGAKAALEQFIKNNRIQGSAIDHIFTDYQELAHSNSCSLKAASALQARFIRELTNYWIKETDNQGRLNSN